MCRRKSQIQTFLEQNEGAGLQHLALKTDDVFKTIELMRAAEDEFGGFELMRRPSEDYYRDLPNRLGDKLSVSMRSRFLLRGRATNFIVLTFFCLFIGVLG